MPNGSKDLGGSYKGFQLSFEKDWKSSNVASGGLIMIDLGKLQKRQRKIFNPVSEFIESVLNREEGDLFNTYYEYHLEDIEQFKSDLIKCKGKI